MPKHTRHSKPVSGSRSACAAIVAHRVCYRSGGNVTDGTALTVCLLHAPMLLCHTTTHACVHALTPPPLGARAVSGACAAGVACTGDAHAAAQGVFRSYGCPDRRAGLEAQCMQEITQAQGVQGGAISHAQDCRRSACRRLRRPGVFKGGNVARAGLEAQYMQEIAKAGADRNLLLRPGHICAMFRGQVSRAQAWRRSTCRRSRRSAGRC